MLLGFDPDGHGLDDAVARSTLGLATFYDAASRDPTFPGDVYEAGGFG